MIQSPRGSIDIIAHNSFDTENTVSRPTTGRHTVTYTDTEIENKDSSNQLDWSDTIRQPVTSTNTTPVGILKHFTSHGADSNFFRSKPFLGGRRDTHNLMETIVLHTQNCDNGKRKHRSR